MAIQSPRRVRLPTDDVPIVRLSASGLQAAMEARVIGQNDVIKAIVPYLTMYQAGLNPASRPPGVFLLLGPTGTGKTKTVEALAEVMLGREQALLTVDCAEFQHSHEVAKLIGSPPGYLGHRETHPALSQEILNQYHTESMKLSFVLFDEIEKASDALWALLLGIMDKARLTLGDNRKVDFSRTFIFMTSNLGAQEIGNALRPGYGFYTPSTRKPGALASIGMAAARKKFTPEFMNRIDLALTYEPLSRPSLWQILDLLIQQFEELVRTRLTDGAFDVVVTREARKFLLKKGTSIEYGARELKRVLERHVVHAIATMVAAGEIAAGSRVTVDFRADGEGLVLAVE